MEENHFEFTPEQIEQFQRMSEAVRDVYDALMEIAKTIIETIRKEFEGLMRIFSKRQLLEWRLSYWMAEFISRKMPVWIAYDVGVRWWKSKTQVIE